jgi:peptidoglycan/LPS O-acetylase OafA/YrhL
MKSKSKFIEPELDSLRGFFAVFILMLHLQDTIKLNLVQNSFILNASICVDFFFILSGFVISKNYFDKIKSKNELSKFFKKRYLRLYPLHFLLLIIFLLVEIVKYFFANQRGLVSNSIPFVQNDIISFFSHLLNLQALFANENSFNGPSWSISVEFFCYFIFALIFYLFNKRLIYVLIFSILLFYIIYFNLNYPVNGIESIIRGLFCFNLGILFYLFKKNKYFYYLTFLSLIFFCILKIYYIFFIILFLIILNIVVSKKISAINSFLKIKVFTFLGSISYGIYMIHHLVIYSLRQVFTFIFNVERISIFEKVGAGGETEKLFLNLSAIEQYSFFIICFSLTIFLSYLSKKYFENFFYRNNRINK